MLSHDLTALERLWFLVPERRPAASLRLFCFPFAGGSATTYFHWSRRLGPQVELWALQLPGRSSRITERPLTSMAPLLDQVTDAMEGRLDQPYAFFGHSMGAVIAFELARRLRDTGAPPPRRLYLSGRRAPQLATAPSTTHLLSDDELWAHVHRYGGMDPVISRDPELKALILPSLRADFSLLASTPYQPGPPLDVPILALGGALDEGVPLEALTAWQEQTVADFDARLLPGGHFYLSSEKDALLDLLDASLRADRARRP